MSSLRAFAQPLSANLARKIKKFRKSGLESKGIYSNENLAFKYEGHHREAGYWSNQFHDLLHYGLLRSDWDSHSD